MAYTTIDDPSQYFQIALYTGNSGSNAITNDGNSDLQPDWVWLKERSSTSSHHSFDSTRGVGDNGKALIQNSSGAEGDDTAFRSFDSDGFTLASSNGYNQDTITNVAWQWKANGGTTTDGSSNDSVSTSNYQANTTAGFSIVSYTGNNSAGATVAHGLGVAPTVLIVKNRDSSRGWMVYHHKNTSAPETEYLWLDDTNATSDYDGSWNDAAPTSTVFSVGNSNETNENNSKHIAYCFAEKQGYSKFGSYTGNGNADGTFVYTGFKPAWCMWKRTDGGSNMWMIMDTKRDTSNVMDKYLAANSNAVEADYDFVDFLSNGFKFRHTSSHANGDGESYIYMAFAENPFVSSKGVPTTAR